MVGLPASAIARNGTDGRAPNAGALAAIMSTYCNMGGSSHPAWYAYQKGGIGRSPPAETSSVDSRENRTALLRKGAKVRVHPSQLYDWLMQKGGIGSSPTAGSRHSTVERAPWLGDWAEAAKRNALPSPKKPFLKTRRRTGGHASIRTRMLRSNARTRAGRGLLSKSRAPMRLLRKVPSRAFAHYRGGGPTRRCAFSHFRY